MKAVVDKALKPDKKQSASPKEKGSSGKPRSSKEGDRQPTLIHWFLENPVREEQEQEQEQVEQQVPDETPRMEDLEVHITDLEARIAQLQTEKQELAEYRSSILLGKERENKQLKRQVTDLEAQILRLNRLLDQKNREIEVLTARMKERDTFVVSLRQTGFFRRAFRWRKCFGSR
ncbi:MAG: hypothetical protein HY709_09135 [Candidatus Latescibacteria bacterium]|nr:hypothetical protein [Candidatus Latescibacterota bacterium]